MTAEPAIPEPSPLDAALAYAAAGIPVHPLGGENGKRALVKDWPNRASSDEAQVREWWARWPEARVGIVTGARSGLCVVDLDVDKETGECTGEREAERLGLADALRGAPCARTRSGGRHFYFRFDGEIANARGIVPGIDIRGAGGYVVAPGSPGYAWQGASILDAAPPPLPSAIPAAIARAKEERRKSDTAAPAPDNVVMLPLARLARDLAAMRAAEPGGNAWAEAALEGELRALRDAPKGQRNEALNRAAFATGSIIGGGGLDRARVERLLAEAARSTGLEGHEIAATIRSGIESGLAEPRTAPERPSGPGIARAPLRAPDGPLFAPASNLAGQPVPSRKWHVRDLIPAETVTMLGGDGGTGKSLLALQLATSTALDRPWIHRAIEAPGRALFLTAEDDLPEVHRRLADICRADGLDLARLRNLFLRSLAGDDALLAVLDRASGILAPTPLYGALDGAMGELRPSLLVLDTLADLHSGEENNRAHARQFIGLLRGLAIRHGAAVLLLAHPSLTGMSSGSGLSGSTAWNGSVRSRLYLDRVLDDGYEPNPDARRLTTKKANYARTGEEIALTWRDGVFAADAPPTGLDRVAASAKAERVFLALLRLFTDQGRYVSASPSNTYAPKVFAEHPSAEGCSRRALKGAMESLLASGRLAIAEHGSGAKARKHLVCNEGCNP